MDVADFSLRFALFSLWCVAERGAQAAIFQSRLHFDLRNKK